MLQGATQNRNFAIQREENVEGKWEKAGYQYFVLFPQALQKPLLLESLKLRVVYLRLKKKSRCPCFLRHAVYEIMRVVVTYINPNHSLIMLLLVP